MQKRLYPQGQGEEGHSKFFYNSKASVTKLCVSAISTSICTVSFYLSLVLVIIEVVVDGDGDGGYLPK
jgi:hypothetical protein